MVSTTSHSKKAGNRPPPPKPPTRVAGRCFPAGERKATTRLYPAVKSNACIALKTGRKSDGEAGGDFAPRCKPSSDGFSTFAHNGPHGGQHRVLRLLEGHGCHPAMERATRGLKTRNTGRLGFELLWGENFAPTMVGSWPLACAEFFLNGSIDGSPPMRASALRRKILTVPLRLVHRSPRRLPQGCVPRRRGAGAVPGCSRRCWSAGRCR